MKLTAELRGTSFYESFSDLIFGTLVLFIVIVLALALKLQTTAEDLVAPNRFSGGAATSRIYTGLVRVGRDPALVFIPNEVIVQLDLEGADPTLTLAQAVVADGEGLFTIPATDVPGFVAGLSLDLWKGHIIDPQATSYADRIVGVYEAWPDAKSLNAQQLRSLIGSKQQPPSPRLTPRVDSYASWLRDGGDSWAKLWEDLVNTGDPRALPQGTGPFLRLTSLESPRRIRIGTVEMSPGACRQVLAAIKPGKGFFVEYVDEDGGAVAPPDWVMEEILSAVGYDGRILSEAGRRLASGG